MDIHITQPDLEAKLTQSAARQAATPTSRYRRFSRGILMKRPALAPPSSAVMHRSVAVSI